MTILDCDLPKADHCRVYMLAWDFQKRLAMGTFAVQLDAQMNVDG